MPLLVNSIDVAHMLALIGAGDLAAVTGCLVDEVEVLTRAGAESGAIVANTPHLVFDAIQSRVTILLISIVEVACAAAREHRCRRLGLFGTALTMQGSF